jgi:hypothetical protein
MSLALYDVTVASYLQTVGAIEGVLGRGLAFCQEKGLDPAEIVETRLYPDMAPFRFQIISVHHHSQNAIAGAKAGLFQPPPDLGPLDYAGLQKLLASTREALTAVSREEVDALQGKDVTFKLRDFAIPFTAENFLLSFSLPNFYFHSTTAYDILRSKGVPVGKRDFLGQMRMKSAA